METSDKARYANRPDGGHDHASQRCLAQQREIARDLVRGSGAGQHLFEMRFDHAAKLGQQQALALAVKHRRADLCFEFFDGCGQYRL